MLKMENETQKIKEIASKFKKEFESNVPILPPPTQLSDEQLREQIYLMIRRDPVVAAKFLLEEANCAVTHVMTEAIGLLSALDTTKTFLEQIKQDYPRTAEDALKLRDKILSDMKLLQETEKQRLENFSKSVADGKSCPKFQNI